MIKGMVESIREKEEKEQKKNGKYMYHNYVNVTESARTCQISLFPDIDFLIYFGRKSHTQDSLVLQT